MNIIINHHQKVWENESVSHCPWGKANLEVIDKKKYARGVECLQVHFIEPLHLGRQFS